MDLESQLTGRGQDETEEPLRRGQQRLQHGQRKRSSFPRARFSKSDHIPVGKDVRDGSGLDRSRRFPAEGGARLHEGFTQAQGSKRRWSGCRCTR